MSEVALVVVGGAGGEQWQGGPIVRLEPVAGERLADLLARVCAATGAPRIVVLDAARAAPVGSLAPLVDALGDGTSAVAARVLRADGSRVAFAGGTADVRTGPVRLGEHAPAGATPSPAETLWLDRRAFAITREAAAALVALPLPLAVDELATGWQLWRAGGRIALSPAITVRALADDAVPPSAGDVSALWGALLDPGTLARLRVRLGPALEQVLEARAALPDPVRGDAEILAAAGLAPLVPEHALPPPLPSVAPGPPRRAVYILCSDAIGPSMAGPGIRAVELGRALAGRFDVTVLARRVTGPVDLPGTIGELRRETLAGITAGRDPIVLQGPLTDWFPQVLNGTAPVAVDLYDPMNLEALEHPDADTHVPYATRLLVEQVTRGDFFVCASERQRDYWLGMLAACGRVDSAAYRQDPDLRGLIDVVPFGLPREAPVRTGPGPREQVPGIGPDDPLFVWNGGLWDWFDPDTLLDAAVIARETVPALRILFMGIRRPGDPALSPAAQALVERSDALGLTGRTVFFRDWTPYGERQNTYVEATAAVSLHRAHLESRFSFRTRMLDCIWATLPIIGTEGDVLADLVRERSLGLGVRPGDAAGVADALVALAQDRDGVTSRAREGLRDLVPAYRWDAAAAPLAAWAERVAPRASVHEEPQAIVPAGLPLAARLRPAAGRLRRALRARLG